MVAILNNLEKMGQEIAAKQKTQLNVDFIIANRDDWVESFPNKWIAVDNENILLADYDFFNLFKIMDRRDAVSNSIVFYYSNNYHIPVIVKLCDARS